MYDTKVSRVTVYGDNMLICKTLITKCPPPWIPASRVSRPPLSANPVHFPLPHEDAPHTFKYISCSVARFSLIIQSLHAVSNIVHIASTVFEIQGAPCTPGAQFTGQVHRLKKTVHPADACFSQKFDIFFYRSQLIEILPDAWIFVHKIYP